MKLRLNPRVCALAFSLLDSGASSLFFPLLIPLLRVNNSEVRPWISRLSGHRYALGQDGPHFPQTATAALTVRERALQVLYMSLYTDWHPQPCCC